MAAACTSPLVSPTHYDASFKVDVRLHEGLLSRGTTPGSIRLEMMSLYSQLEVMCKKEEMQHVPGQFDHGRFSNSFTDRVTVVCDRMFQVLSKSSNTPQDSLTYMQSQGMDKLFPRAETYLADPHNSSAYTGPSPSQDYYSSLASINQLLVIARQIHSDLTNLSDQKYIAHQLAVLYQSVTTIKGSCFSQHKQSIEENFKAIKATLGSGGSDHKPNLTPEQREWLLNVTSNIINTINGLPANLTPDLLTPARILQTRI